MYTVVDGDAIALLQYPHPTAPRTVVLAAKLQPPTPSLHGRPPEAQRVIRAPTSQAAAVGKRGPDIGRHASAGPSSAPLLTGTPSRCYNITTPPARGRSFALRTTAPDPLAARQPARGTEVHPGPALPSRCRRKAGTQHRKARRCRTLLSTNVGSADENLATTRKAPCHPAKVEK